MCPEMLRWIRNVTLGQPVHMYRNLGISRRTYQEYEAGNRRIPPCVAFCVRLELKIMNTFWENMPTRVDEQLKRQYGAAIIPAAVVLPGLDVTGMDLLRQG